MIIGAGVAIKGARALQQGRMITYNLAKITQYTTMAVDGLLVLNDVAEGVKEIRKGNVASGLMHFGGGFLRLLGLRQTFINRLRCFPAGTPVHTPNGPRAIETIVEGDHVWAFDFETDRWESRQVTAIHRNWNAAKLIQITADGKLIESTPSHPFWVVSGENLEERPASLHREALNPDTNLPGRWVDAGDLSIGDEVLLLDGRKIKIESLGIRESAEFVYNFAVDDLHTYAVGESGILVHNTCKPPAPVATTDAGPVFRNFNDAQVNALAWLRGRGFDPTKAQPSISKFTGEVNGLKMDGNIGFRIEFDTRNGAHINVFAGKEKGPHFLIENVNEAGLNAILRQLFGGR